MYMNIKQTFVAWNARLTILANISSQSVVILKMKKDMGDDTFQVSNICGQITRQLSDLITVIICYRALQE